MVASHKRGMSYTPNGVCVFGICIVLATSLFHESSLHVRERPPFIASLCSTVIVLASWSYAVYGFVMLHGHSPRVLELCRLWLRYAPRS
ncbi:hypothetical protein A2U01_0001551 [Trifolium medium]|uniref:Uncharacterized protein n=1 Tax=Trifolium medium TaxID=97028 RepID=A0A392M0E0_9FABA|nr:hypothetical protein [Trifolium medium]